MTAVQSTYTEGMRAPAPGTISGSDYDTITGNCETAAGIPFGVAVATGTVSTHGDKATVIGGALATFKGIAVRDITLAPSSASQDKYLERGNMTILRRGQIWVEPREAVVANDPVYFIAATGVLSNSASGALGPINGARWVTSSTNNTDGAGRRAEVYLPGLQKLATV